MYWNLWFYHDLYVQLDAVFQQRTVTKCGFEEMLLDCDPPCDYQEQQFRNGSTYCEIAYPSHTAKKAYVLLNNTSKQVVSQKVSNYYSLSMDFD